jgi:hypothetical protein
MPHASVNLVILTMIKNLKKILFKSNKLYFLVFFLIHLTFILLIRNFTALSPDEIGYVGTFEKLFTGKDEADIKGGSGWIAAPTLFLLISLTPAKVFDLILNDSLFSIRLQSILIITFCVYLIGNFAYKEVFRKKQNMFLLLGIFSIPSFFLWSSAAMREVFIFFGLTLVFLGLKMAYGLSYRLRILSLVIGMLILLCVKFYLAALVMIAIAFGVGLDLFNRRVKRAFLLFTFSSLIPILIFLSISSTYTLENLKFDGATGITERSGDSVIKIKAGEKELIFHGNTTSIEINNFIEKFPNRSMSKLIVKLGILKDLEFELNASKKSKSNQIEFYSSDEYILKPAKIGNPISVIRQASYFMVMPIPFTKQTSLVRSLASFENILWYSLYLLVLWSIFRTKIKYILNNQLFIVLITFIPIFISASALTEVNFGTAFRHRSVLVIPLVFVIAEAFQNKYYLAKPIKLLHR